MSIRVLVVEVKLIAVSNIKDEADIITATITNLAQQGVDSIITTDGQSTDGTRDILSDLSRTLIPIRVINDPCEFHHQHALMNMVAALAQADDADWVLPFDADEFWSATSHATIREALSSVDVSIASASTYQYFDYERREELPKLFPKVVFRPTGDFDLSMGSHSVIISNYNGPIAVNLLTIREVQFRGFDHFRYKVRQRTAAFPPDVPSGNGAHVRTWGAMSDDELVAEWAVMDARATVSEPILIDPDLIKARA